MENSKQTVQIEKVSAINDVTIDELNLLLDDKYAIEEGKKFLEDPNNGLFLAFSDKHVVGFLTAHKLQRLDKKTAEVLLYEVAVAPEYQQRGIGKALIGKVREWAKELHADNVWVLTNRSNAAAMALYQSAGGKIEHTDEQMFTFKT